MWPDLNSLCEIFGMVLVWCCENCTYFGNFYPTEQIFNDVNGQILKNKIAIWPLCQEDTFCVLWMTQHSWSARGKCYAVIKVNLFVISASWDIKKCLPNVICFVKTTSCKQHSCSKFELFRSNKILLLYSQNIYV